MWYPSDARFNIFDTGCHYVGQYLKHPKDECKFLVCDYGNEPWKDEYGKIQVSFPTALENLDNLIYLWFCFITIFS